MSTYASPDLKVEVDSKDLSQYVLENIEVDIEGLTEEGHGFGKSWVEQLFTGIKQGNELTLGGLYDDTATTGPDAVLNKVGTEVAVVITWGGTKKSSFSAIVKSYKRTAIRGELHKFSAALLPSGEVTET